MAGQFDRIVQPGESGKIPIKINTSHGNGAISKAITVNTNAPGAEAQVMLQIKGEAWPAIQVTPPSAAFGRITPEQAVAGATRKLTITKNVEGEMNLGAPTSNNAHFKADISPIEAGKKYELTVTLIPPLTSGNNSGQIELTTGLADMPKLTIPSYAFVTPSIDVTPNNLTLPGNRSADVSRVFFIRSNTDKPIKISNLTATNPGIKLELSDFKDSKTFRLNVTVPATCKLAPGGERITFSTDDPAVSSITIPVSETSAIAQPRSPAIRAGPMTNPRIPPKKAATINRQVPVKSGGAPSTGNAGMQPGAGKPAGTAATTQPAGGSAGTASGGKTGA